MESTCKTCAWYCHADGKCYGTEQRLAGTCNAQSPHNWFGNCRFWQFDGLEDWERTDCEKTAFMAMA